MYSFIALFLTTFTAAFTYNVFIIIGVSFFMGVGLETNATQMKLLTIEVLGKQRRGFWMFFCDFFQVFGYSTVTFLIVLMETATLLNWNHSNFIKPPTWRTMFAVSGGASLILACASGLLEESPRYYLYLGRNYLAFLLIKQLFAINNSNFADNFMIKEEELVGLIKNFDLRYEEPTLYWQKIKKCLWRFWKSVKLMCSNHYFKNCWLLTLLKAPLIAISVFQLNVLLAKLLIYDQSVIEKKFNGLQLIFPIFDRNGTFNSICETNQQTKVFYTNLIVLSSVMMIGPILGMLVIDYIGRKLLAFSSLLIASASFLLMAFLNDVVIQTIIACCIVIHITITYSVISLVNLELFPTAFRATSAEITNIPGYILALFVVNFFETESKLLLIIMGLSYCCKLQILAVGPSKLGHKFLRSLYFHLFPS
ncbi:hypothetical protein ABEB36_004931 [Hypothenemus hampei]|uniref:Major facilitator superfamily (MFS) profile domain-containing protein n=1 Tax=Hypothenemus hampei TaxID=57062 RepID=A0ABD1EWF0_HYPHA